jgi:hypothetical protein
VPLAAERATSEAHSAEDLVLHLEICDIINETDSGPRDAAKILKKKLTPKSTTGVLMKTLIVTDTCVKNCGKRFQLMVRTQARAARSAGLFAAGSGPPGDDALPLPGCFGHRSPARILSPPCSSCLATRYASGFPAAVRWLVGFSASTCVLPPPPQGLAGLVQDKILSLVQAWAEAFRSDPAMSAVVNAYQDLLVKGTATLPRSAAAAR